MPRPQLEITDERVARRFGGMYRVGEDIPVGLTTPCWVWQRAKDKNGYGLFKFNGDLYRAHRFSLMMRGIDPGDGMDVDHLCQNHSCVNWQHLESITHAENMRRMQAAKDITPVDDNGDPLPVLTPSTSPTDSDVILEWLEELVEGQPELGTGLGITEKTEGAPWRAYADNFENSLGDDKFALAALVLYALANNIETKDVALRLLHISPVTFSHYNRNKDWRGDCELARWRGRTAQVASAEDKVLRTIEAKAVHMPTKDLVAVHKSLMNTPERKVELLREQKGNDSSRPTLFGVQVNLINGSTPENVEVRVRTIEELDKQFAAAASVPALPSPVWEEPDVDDEDDD